MILSASPLEQNRILGNTDLGKVVEAARPTTDGSEGKFPLSCSSCCSVFSLLILLLIVQLEEQGHSGRWKRAKDKEPTITRGKSSTW